MHRNSSSQEPDHRRRLSVNPACKDEPRSRPQPARVAGIAVLVSLFSFLYYFQHGRLLLYGDAVAHINIARRVFDSLTPGLLQLGTVWLPLPHLLMIPFIFLERCGRAAPEVRFLR
jgi:hypothetical protein